MNSKNFKLASHLIAGDRFCDCRGDSHEVVRVETVSRGRVNVDAKSLVNGRVWHTSFDGLRGMTMVAR